MAEAIGLASGVAQLVAIAVQITQLSYSYVSDVVNAPRAQKTYLQEVSALTDVLFRLEQGLQDLEALGPAGVRPVSLSEHVISECHQRLVLQRFKLEKQINRLIWPFHDRELKKAIDELHRFRNTFADYLVANISTTLSATFQTVDKLRCSQDKAQLLEWLEKPNNTSKMQPTALPGTGAWLLNHSQFSEWLTEPPSILWCYGPPGVGKSFLASIAIDYLSKHGSLNNSCITYYFSDFTARKDQTEKTILQTILRQVVESGTEEAVSLLLNHCKQSRSISRPLSLAFAEVCRKQETYLVLDAPDELETKQIIQKLQYFADAGCRVLVTSRDHPDLRDAFSNARQIEAYASNEDMTVYVQHRFEDSDFRDTVGHTHSVVESVVKKSNGLFLLVKLLMDQLLGLPSIKKMRKSLESLPTKLSEAFESSIERIDMQPEPLREMAHRLIDWVVHTERPLQPAEIIHAFAVELEDDEIDEESLTTVRTLLRICAGLVVLEQASNTLRMVHISAYEYFNVHKARIHEDIAKISLTYLCVRSLQAGPCTNLDGMKRRLRELPFLKYAARYWGRHVSHPPTEERLGDLIARLLNDPNYLSSSVQALHYRDTIKDHAVATATMSTLPMDQSRLHVAAYWGLLRTTEDLLKEKVDINAVDSQRWTPLHWAASNGHVAVMKILLEEGAEIDAQDSQLWTPLFWASFNGNVPALSLLLNRKANYTSKDVHGWTALHWAVSKGEETSVSVLLKHHAESELVDGLFNIWSRSPATLYSNNNRKTPVDIAVEAMSTGLFDLLLHHQRDTNGGVLNVLWMSGHFDPPMSNMWRTMNKAEQINGQECYISHTWEKQETSDTVWKGRLLHTAIRDCKLLVVQLLLSAGADVNHHRSRSPLHTAAFRKDPEFAKVLIQNGADVSLRDSHGQTALHQAVLNGFEETIAVLLRGGSDVNARRGNPRDDDCDSRKGATAAGNQAPLMLACGYRYRSVQDCDAQSRVVNLLILHGADVHLDDENGTTCLHYAAISRNVDIVRTMLKLGAHVNRQNEEGVTALHFAAKSCNVNLVKLLIDHGANIELIDTYNRSAVHYLASGNDSRVDLNDLKSVFQLVYSCTNSGIHDVDYDVVASRGGSHSSDSLRRHTPMSEAIDCKNWQLFRILRESIISLPEKFSGLLNKAVEDMQSEAVHFLIEKGAILGPEASNTVSYSFNHEVRCHASLCSAIRQYGSSLNATHLDLILEDLLSIGLDINQSDQWHCSILQAAAGTINSGPVAEVLLRHGGDPYVDFDQLDSFLLAAIHGNLDFLHSLLENAPSPFPNGHWIREYHFASATDSDDLNKIIIALKESSQLENRGKDGRTVLSAAVVAGNQRFVERLLAHGANAESSDVDGWRPLHRAAVSGHKAIVTSLLKAGVEVDAPTETWSSVSRPSGLYNGDKWTGTALHLAAMMGNKEMAALLLNSGADIDTSTAVSGGRGSHGPTALHMCLSDNISYAVPVANLGDERLRVARILIERGACVDTVADHLQRRHMPKFVNYEDVWWSIRPARYRLEEGPAVETANEVDARI